MKPKSNLFHPSALLVVIASLGAASYAQAQTNYTWNGSPTASSAWTTTGNWTSSSVGVTGGTSDSRLNVYNGSGSALVYSSAQGTTVYASSGRGLVISAATNAVAGSFEITGGSFSTLGSASGDIIGNAATGTLTVSGGSFTGTAAGTILGLNSGSGTSTLTVSGSLSNPGSATVSTLQLSAATVNVNLNTYGTLTANQIIDVDNAGLEGLSNTTFNFNGGTLKAGSGAVTDFMGLSGSSNALTNAYVRSGGAKIDTNGKSITISQALLDGTGGGGLTLDDTAVTKGTLTLSGTNTYTGATIIKSGTLKLNTSTSIGSSASITVGDTGSSGAALDATTAGFTIGATQTLGGIGTIFATGQTVTASGTVSPGNSVGTLTIDGGTLALNADTDFVFELGTSSDLISLVNSATLNLGAGTLGLADFLFSNSGGFGAGVYTLISGASSFSGSLDSSNLTGEVLGYNSTLSMSGNNLILTVVPEPRAALLGSLGMLMLLRRRR